MKKIAAIWRSGWLGKIGIVLVVLFVIGGIQSALGINPKRDDPTATPVPAAQATIQPTSTSLVNPSATLPPKPTNEPEPTTEQPGIEVPTERLPVSRDEIQALMETTHGITFGEEKIQKSGVVGISYRDDERLFTFDLTGNADSLFNGVAVIALVDSKAEYLETFFDYTGTMIEGIVPSIESGKGRAWIDSHLDSLTKDGQYTEVINGVSISMIGIEGGIIITAGPDLTD